MSMAAMIVSVAAGGFASLAAALAAARWLFMPRIDDHVEEVIRRTVNGKIDRLTTIVQAHAAETTAATLKTAERFVRSEERYAHLVEVIASNQRLIEHNQDRIDRLSP